MTENNSELKELEELAKAEESAVVQQDSVMQKETDARQDLELESIREELNSRKQDREQRGEYVGKIHDLVSTYIAVVLMFVLFQGLGFLRISDKVMITLLSTTTINVIGIFIIVAKYLFHTKE